MAGTVYCGRDRGIRRWVAEGFFEFQGTGTPTATATVTATAA